MLCGVAAEAVNAVVFDPLGKPCGQVIGNCARAAVFIELLLQGTFLAPLCLEEGRNGNSRCGLGAEVGKTFKAAFLIAGVIVGVAGKSAAYPTGAPPTTPVGRAGLIVYIAVERAGVGELILILLIA